MNVIIYQIGMLKNIDKIVNKLNIIVNQFNIIVFYFILYIYNKIYILIILLTLKFIY